MKATTWKEKGTFHQGGKTNAFTGGFAMHLPDRQRMDMTFDKGNAFVLVLNGDHGWVKRGGETKDLEAAVLAYSKQNLYGDLVVSLTPLADKSYTLSLVPDEKIGERVVSGVKVTHAGHADMHLYFDKNTGLLSKSVHRLKRSGADKEVEQAILYDEYQDFDGLKRPTQLRVLMDGQLYIESNYYGYRLSEKLDDKVFERP
ncbi:MAG: hypothetical protein HY040_25410 [Planctomycetes bacterium]|nr:hypothetical protein [Planctomycetota bacterium]